MQSYRLPPQAPPVIEPVICDDWWNRPDGAYNPDCPDADGDMIYDHLDDCPNQDGYGTLHGCPDLDYDGVRDSQDLCPETPYGLDVDQNGCDDRDGDGIPTNEDVCPSAPGGADLSGCPPAVDRDGDGILNFQDWCPAVNTALYAAQGVQDINGCPDYDFDTLASSPRADNPDFCAHVAGPVENGGCPPVLDLFEFVDITGSFQDIIVAIEPFCVEYLMGIYGDLYCSAYNTD